MTESRDTPTEMRPKFQSTDPRLLRSHAAISWEASAAWPLWLSRPAPFHLNLCLTKSTQSLVRQSWIINLPLARLRAAITAQAQLKTSKSTLEFNRTMAIPCPSRTSAAASAKACSTTASACRMPLKSVKEDRKSTRLNSSHVKISYAVFCLKKKSAKELEHDRL